MGQQDNFCTSTNGIVAGGEGGGMLQGKGGGILQDT